MKYNRHLCGAEKIMKFPTIKDRHWKNDFVRNLVPNFARKKPGDVRFALYLLLSLIDKNDHEKLYNGGDKPILFRDERTKARVQNDPLVARR